VNKHWSALEDKRWQDRAANWRSMSANDLTSLKNYFGPIYIDIAPKWFVEEFFPL
jgi:hypothetical protein